jgi:hypothetical protein
MGNPMAFRISASIRLLFAMFSLKASIEENYGRGLKDLFKNMFPDQAGEIESQMSASAVGQKLMGIVLKQVQYDHTRAEDVLADFFQYLLGGKQKIDPGTGDVISPTPYDYSKNFDHWDDALDALYANLRNRAMSESMGYFKKKKQTKTIDQAYGQRGEDGGAASGGEGRIPTSDETALGKSLDDHAALKHFIDLMDQYVADLRDELPSDQKSLFDLIFEDNIGTFGSNIKDNMKQADFFADKRPDLHALHAKRWSGYVGDLRKKLLKSILDFVDESMTGEEMDAFYDAFFSGTDLDIKKQEEKEKAKADSRLDYQQGIDERKIAKFKWYEQNDKIPEEFLKGGKSEEEASEKFKKVYDNLLKKLKNQNVDVDSIPAIEDPDDKKWELHTKKKHAASSIDEWNYAF